MQDKTSYALGLSIAHNMIQSGVGDVDFGDLTAGIKDGFTGAQPAISFEEAGKLLKKYFTEIENQRKADMEALAGQYREEGEAFLKMNSEKEGVVMLASGLQYKVLEEGAGRKPGPADKVKCHYEGTFVDGRKFDSSYDRKEPAIFGVNQVIPGWTEALQMMSEGSVWELYIPYRLAYGEAGAPGSIPPCATLIFKVELIEVL